MSRQPQSAWLLEGNGEGGDDGTIRTRVDVSPRYTSRNMRAYAAAFLPPPSSGNAKETRLQLVYCVRARDCAVCDVCVTFLSVAVVAVAVVC